MGGQSKETGKNPHAVALGRLGGLAGKGKGSKEWWASLTPEERRAITVKGGKRGGKARAKNMSKQQRSDSAKKAAAARWNGKK